MKRAAVLALALACSSSGANSPPNPEAAKCVAHRTAKQLECDDLYGTRAEIDACKTKVKNEIDCTKDGGTDGS